MANFGGGIWLTQNKVLPGTYVNFVSAAAAYVNIADRGVAAMGFELDWSPTATIFRVEQSEFLTNSTAIFGYDYTHDKMKPLRDIFQNAQRVYCYKLNSAGASQASNDFGKAKYAGIRGNDITIVVEESVDNPDDFVVKTFLDGREYDVQTVVDATALVDNDFVTWTSTATLVATAGTPMTGGTNGSAPTGADHQDFLDKSEKFRFNTLGAVVTTDTTKQLYAEHTRYMRDDVGVKYQCVLHDHAADYEGVINVINKCVDEGESEASIVYWMVGASAGCAINRSNTNKAYNGSYNIFTDYTQYELTEHMNAGRLVFIDVDDSIVILSDINSFTSWSIYKNEDFYRNQVIRVLDQIAMDIASLFNKRYLGKTQNNDPGRNALWVDAVAHHRELEQMGAIQDFNPDDVVITEGVDKVSVKLDDNVNPVAAMEKLYMTVVVA